MARVYLILALLAVGFWAFSIVDCALQPPARHRGVSKSIWMLIVVIIPVLGGALWFILGRVPAVASVVRAPDDNPEFLGRLGSLSDQDERIRRLEEELQALDSEADDPRMLPPHPPLDGDADGQADPRGSAS